MRDAIPGCCGALVIQVGEACKILFNLKLLYFMYCFLEGGELLINLEIVIEDLSLQFIHYRHLSVAPERVAAGL